MSKSDTIEPPHLEHDLRELKLPAVMTHWRRLAEEAARKRQSAADYLAELTHLEVTTRRERRIQRLLKEARLPVVKTLDGFDFQAQATLDRDSLLELFYLAWFALRLERLGRAPFEPEFIDVSYEFPTRALLAQIRRVFRAPVIDTYGSTECGFVFSSCERGRYHHNAAWSHVELLALPRVEGAALLVVTPLGNPWLNLVRFDIELSTYFSARSNCDSTSVLPVLFECNSRQNGSSPSSRSRR